MGQINKQRGVALAMILWFIAGLALLVSGIVSLSRTDVKQVQLELQRTSAAAAGDGASFLALRDLLLLQEEGEFKGRGVFEGQYTIGELDVSVRVVPTAGLVNLNKASLALLTAMLESGMGLDSGEAEEIANNIIIWRGAESLEEDGSTEYKTVGESEAPRYGRFEVAEDLMQVAGISRERYDRVADLIVGAAARQAGVDPLSAPAGVLAAVTGDASIAQDIAATRRDSPFEENEISAAIPEEYITKGSSPFFRIDADVTMEDGKIYRRRGWVQRNNNKLDPLPWNVLRREPVQVVG